MTPKKIIRLFYGFQFFFSLLIWLPIFYRYQHDIGLNDEQIFRIQSIYYTFFCFLEIPTGLVADYWGHRRCLIAGAITLIISNFLPIYFQSYTGFLLHFLTIALARSFVSGASSAYLYNYLASKNLISEYKQIEGNARAYGLVGKVFCWAAVGWLMGLHFTLPYWLTVLAAIFSLFFAWFLPSNLNLPTKENVIQSHFFKEFSQSLVALQKSPTLILIMIQGIAIFVLSRICQVNLFQPILEKKTFALWSFGPIMSAMTIFEALGSAKPKIIRYWFDDLNAVFVLTAVMAICLALMTTGPQLAILVLLCIFSFATGLSFPVQRQLLNDAIVDSRYRATMMSIESIIDRAVCAISAGYIGSFLVGGRLTSFLVLSAGWTLATLVVLAFGFRFVRLRGGGSNAAPPNQ